jgi:hypothetical protein
VFSIVRAEKLTDFNCDVYIDFPRFSLRLAAISVSAFAGEVCAASETTQCNISTHAQSSAGRAMIVDQIHLFLPCLRHDQSNPYSTHQRLDGNVKAQLFTMAKYLSHSNLKKSTTSGRFCFSGDSPQPCKMIVEPQV